MKWFLAVVVPLTFTHIGYEIARLAIGYSFSLCLLCECYIESLHLGLAWHQSGPEV